MAHTIMNLSSVEEFKSLCKAKAGTLEVDYRESGENGWSCVGDLLDRADPTFEGPPCVSRPGPHWLDARIPGRIRLVGTFDLKNGTARFFE